MIAHDAASAAEGNCYCLTCTSAYLAAKRELDSKLRSGEISVERVS